MKAILCMQAVPQADVLQPPLLQPVYSFWSPIPTRTRTMTAQLQGNQILPFPGYQRDASLGAIKKSLANVATYVALDGVTSSNQGQLNGIHLCRLACLAPRANHSLSHHHGIVFYMRHVVIHLECLGRGTHADGGAVGLSSPMPMCSCGEEADGVPHDALRQHHLRF